MNSILQLGAPKCGNFWLYQIIRQILERSACAEPAFIEKHPIYPLAKTWDLNFPDQAKIDVLEITDLQYKYRISSIFQMPVDDIRFYIQNAPHIWSHSPICKRSFELYNLVDKKVYIIRDPRDRAISASKYYCSPYMLKYFPQEQKDPVMFLAKDFDALMYEWVWHVFDHLKYQDLFNIHIAFFEGFLLDFQRQLNLLLEYMEVDLSSSERAALEEAVHFSTLKKSNPKHLKKGQCGYWMDHLSDEQKERAEFIAGPLMRFLQYPSNPQRGMNLNTDPWHSDYDQLKQEILESQELMFQS